MYKRIYTNSVNFQVSISSFNFKSQSKDVLMYKRIYTNGVNFNFNPLISNHQPPLSIYQIPMLP